MHLKDKILAVIEPTIEALGFECWGCEYLVQGRRALLRVYIEHANGVTVEDCARVSSQLSTVLDVEDLIDSRYALEVSSPGLERPLFTLGQYQRYVGSPVQVRLREAQQGRRQFSGVLQSVSEDNLELLVEGELHRLSMSNIDKANIRYQP